MKSVGKKTAGLRAQAIGTLFAANIAKMPARLDADNWSNEEAPMNRKSSILLSLGFSIALIAAGIWILCGYQNNLCFSHDGWMMPYHLMTGGGGMGIVLILFWVAVLSAIGLVISGMISNRRSSGRNSSEKPMPEAEQRQWPNRHIRIRRHEP